MDRDQIGRIDGINYSIGVMIGLCLGIYAQIAYTAKSSVDTIMPMYFNEPDNKTDVLAKGDADDICLQLAELIGWKDDLLRLQSTRNAELEREFEEERKKSSA
ncbi:hypothetical protein ACTXT7_011989 [Hymenolepis weldensis]